MPNPFKVNQFYKEKHAILKALYDHWEDGERKTNYGHTVTPIGRALSVLDLQDITSLNRREIEKFVISLSNSGHIELLQKDQDLNQKNHKWIITENGKQAISDNYYLNQFGLDNRHLLFQAGGFVIALLSLFFAGASYLQSNYLEKRVDRIENRADKNKSGIQQNTTLKNDTTNTSP
jgi:hypothetical protein